MTKTTIESRKMLAKFLVGKKYEKELTKLDGEIKGLAVTICARQIDELKKVFAMFPTLRWLKCDDFIVQFDYTRREKGETPYKTTQTLYLKGFVGIDSSRQFKMTAPKDIAYLLNKEQNLKSKKHAECVMLKKSICNYTTFEAIKKDFPKLTILIDEFISKWLPKSDKVIEKSEIKPDNIKFMRSFMTSFNNMKKK